MIDWFRVWIISLMTVSAVLTILSTLLPEGAVKKIAGVTGGLVLLLTILRGISSLELKGFRLSYDQCARQIDRQMETYRLQSSRNLESLIQERCAAYISEQAQSFGLECSPQVETRWTDDNIPVPTAVKMDIAYHGELSRIIEENLGIGAEGQTWQSSKG